ncbi:MULTISPECIES: malate/lactate/ureidoglycolate dehydrogenase [unclassified Brenneria]|uniref:malate/lactate/ureidoglycolate dehydrogenase n=1 Tax=unclassified Brenneria TaxID=2634434 RepID=UPI001555B9FA|nr:MULTISPECIES: malate/lactate/ureidoglycolate dehydrogenase [unclassified Brenneria]MBJ7220620.1 malate/lactate/ureidoglycolate dehydrogenase [Brenneria sp. L3-3C-1]MEE3641863.1 malate/lactate/ureidoglycolate dehydrogenase [Brenneria sp. L3_3C_1]MEE3649440.1 malate/lactate/ureidoglycolate dehydrogenase [Brenneria sp. HEZEL_4_2_4]NPC99396.1 malate/lactate/ureidoglycolate dehydrogenase [Brenneria sp. hezel4-2-4]
MQISESRLTGIAQALLQKVGCEEQEAACVAEHLVAANLKGHDSHGVGMLPHYVSFIADGVMHPNTPARKIRDGGAVLQFSGERGFGQRTGKEAMQAAIERVKTTGVCLMTLSSTCHLGRIGTYGEMAAKAGLVSIHFVNVNDLDPIVAPWCGSEARFGTNPICIAFPGSENNAAFVLDFATSIVALGKTRVAYLAGKKFDEEVMLDANGISTNDPRVMWEGEKHGALKPIARHKGGGLIIAAELLAGLLSGGGTIQPENPRRGAIVNNMTTIVIDPASMVSMAWLQTEYDAMLDYVRSSTAPDPEQPILIAGEPEIKTRARRQADGIVISDQEWQKIVEAGVSLGMSAEDFTL